MKALHPILSALSQLRTVYQYTSEEKQTSRAASSTMLYYSSRLALSSTPEASSNPDIQLLQQRADWWVLQQT